MGDGDFEIGAHAHAEARDARLAGDLRKKREVRHRLIVEGPDAHQPGDRQTERVAAAGLLILRDGEPGEPVVTLNGQVPGLASKRLAGLLAWWVPGSRDVINGLAVEPPEEDAPIRIEEAVRIALKKDPFVEASQIRVGVRHTTVRLTGLVPTDAERDMAERDAWYIFGVDRVVNEIEVRR